MLIINPINVLHIIVKSFKKSYKMYLFLAGRYKINSLKSFSTV